MARGRLGNPGTADRILHRALENRFVEMVAAALAREAIHIYAGGREDPLPPQSRPAFGYSASQRAGELDPAGALPEVGLVLRAHALDVGDQRGLDRGRQHCHSILAPLAVADDDLV